MQLNVLHNFSDLYIYISEMTISKSKLLPSYFKLRDVTVYVFMIVVTYGYDYALLFQVM